MSATDQDIETNGGAQVIYSASTILTNAYAVAVSFMLFYCFFARYLLEPVILPKLWGKTFTDLSVKDKRSFISHHIWLIAKLFAATAVYPLIRCLFGGHNLSESITGNSIVTNADYLSVAWMAILAMFAFELIFRVGVSPVSTIHHTAGISLAIWQLTTQVDVFLPAENADQDILAADTQFLLIMIYGAFEVIFESYPHIAVILYRHYKGQHAICSRIWLIASIGALCGSLGEVIAVAVFMRFNWQHFHLSMKIAMPIIHFAFMAAQMHGVRVEFNMSRAFAKKARDQVKAAGEGALPILSRTAESEALEEEKH